MSHLVCSSIVITDIEILKKAAKIMGLVFHENKKQFVWYNGKTDPCDHAISAQEEVGRGYEIGVVRNEDGTGWKLVHDPYDHDLASIVGNECEKLGAAYSEAYIRDFAEKNGFMVDQTTDENGNVKLVLNNEQ